MKKTIMLIAVALFATLTTYNVLQMQTAKADTGLDWWYEWLYEISGTDMTGEASNGGSHPPIVGCHSDIATRLSTCMTMGHFPCMNPSAPSQSEDKCVWTGVRDEACSMYNEKECD